MAPSQRFTDREKSNVVVVDQDYPAECIQYHMLVNPKQKQFLVKGYTPPVAPIEHTEQAQDNMPVVSSSSDPSQTSKKSLQLKPARKSVMARSTQTPSRAEDTPSLPPNGDTVDAEDDDDRNEPDTGADELEAVIREAKDTDHLVNIVRLLCCSSC